MIRVDGPIDVQQNIPNGDLQLLGVEMAWGHYFVTGRNRGLPNQTIYWFDLDGNYVSEIRQTTTSPEWGHRDMASDEANNLLYAGNEGGEFHTYQWDGTTLTHVSTITVPGVGTIRALARRPSDGHFFTKNFGGSIFEFDASGTVFNTWGDPGSSAYGAAWDCFTETLWLWDGNGTQNPAGIRAIELDPATMTFTGRECDSINIENPDPLYGQAPGGMDIGVHPLNPGRLSMIGMHQIGDTAMPPQEGIQVYDLDPGCGCGFAAADMNCDGVVDATDIEPFICLLFDPNCVPCSPCAGDINGDGTVNAEDIEPFINILFP